MGDIQTHVSKLAYIVRQNVSYYRFSASADNLQGHKLLINKRILVISKQIQFLDKKKSLFI